MNKQFAKEQEIKALLERYFEAVYNADVPTLREIFHKNAAMYGYLGENSVVGTPEIFFADLSSKPSMAADQVDCRCVIEDIHVSEGIATAAILVDGFFGAFTVRDLFHLLYTEEKWQIVCKTFTTL